MHIDLLEPDFPPDVARRQTPCTPRELYCCLLDVEAHVHYVESAFRFVVAAMDAVEPPTGDTTEPMAYVTALVEAAAADLVNRPSVQHATSWTRRVVREFAPCGLTDGAWLHGAVRANVIETDTGMAALKQLMIRFGDPSSHESYAQRYSLLLQSIGVAPASISRWEREEAAPCAAISYEHALLGLALGLFPQSLADELLGFNLWMAALGPSPLVEDVARKLRAERACLRYIDEYDRDSLRGVAIAAATVHIDTSPDALARTRVARGFLAAHRSYLRWEQAMLGRNIPVSARDFVLEAIRRKAHFAVTHHARVTLDGARLDRLFAEGTKGHHAVLERLAASPLIVAGQPDRSRLLTHSLSINGPMFEVFTETERRDLAEWITTLGAGETNASTAEPVPLAGVYGCPHDPGALQRHVVERHAALPIGELFYRCANVDLYPTVRVFARLLVERVLAKVEVAFETDTRLGVRPPKWSERAAAEMVIERHARNVQGRQAAVVAPPPVSAETRPPISMAFDGAWLQGFVDVHKSDREEYGWLCRIYASEQGDGDLAWNHNRIARKGWRESVGEQTMIPATDHRLYTFCVVPPMALLTMAASLNTRRFLPELLGANLGIEATGVCGGFIDAWQQHAKSGNTWTTLNFRLHNSIDNYETGHTKWSLAAVQSFMSRVSENAPAAVDPQWQRIWRIWRVQEIAEHGSEQERHALGQALGFPVSSLAAVSVA